MNPSQLASIERRLARERAFWLTALDGSADVTLPLDFARAPEYDGRKLAVTIALDEASAERAAAVSRRKPPLGLTLLLAAMAAQRHRSAGVTDVVFATPIADGSPAAALND